MARNISKLAGVMRRHITYLADSGRTECFDNREREDHSLEEYFSSKLQPQARPHKRNCIAVVHKPPKSTVRESDKRGLETLLPSPLSDPTFNAADSAPFQSKVTRKTRTQSSRTAVVKKESSEKQRFKIEEFGGLEQVEDDVDHASSQCGSSTLDLNHDDLQLVV
ncbi:hypothetical protein BDZ89DRAFT_1036520 [Hymenopellis radicata]|nr:hypothetical protein BDZ89DRAFT_1036520 [Hymenopellis radicata]